MKGKGGGTNRLRIETADRMTEYSPIQIFTVKSSRYDESSSFLEVKNNKPWISLVEWIPRRKFVNLTDKWGL